MSDLETKMRASVQAYFDLYNVKDAKGIADMFADDATVEDPFGTEPKRGKAEILKFYTMAMDTQATLERLGETRIAANIAAFPFAVEIGNLNAENTAVDVDLPAGSMRIEVIDTFEFNDAGKITSMKAYWGPSNITKG